jgi:glutathione S-transferase
MNQPPIILHHDQRTAGSHRIKKIMALKGLAWGSCALEPGVGTSGAISTILSGEMGHPVLQKGPNFWVSGLAVIDAVEELFPEPTLFPNGNRGMPLALSWWSDDLAGQTEGDRADAHAALILRQLSDGRDFLQGPVPGLADAQAYAGLSVAWCDLVSSIFLAGKDPLLSDWFERVTALGEGDRQDMSAQEARQTVESGDQTTKGTRLLAVSECGAKKGISIEGRDLSSNNNQISIEITEEITEPTGAFTVHFPAIGYTATPI